MYSIIIYASPSFVPSIHRSSDDFNEIYELAIKALVLGDHFKMYFSSDLYGNILFLTHSDIKSGNFILRGVSK